MVLNPAADRSRQAAARNVWQWSFWFSRICGETRTCSFGRCRVPGCRDKQVNKIGLGLEHPQVGEESDSWPVISVRLPVKAALSPGGRGDTPQVWDVALRDSCSCTHSSTRGGFCPGTLGLAPSRWLTQICGTPRHAGQAGTRSWGSQAHVCGPVPGWEEHDFAGPPRAEAFRPLIQPLSLCSGEAGRLKTGPCPVP